MNDHTTMPARLCWICGAPADSREHRVKKTDIVRAYGRGPYRGCSAPVHIREGELIPVQGPGANTLKYTDSLCRECNSTRTQPFDLAYDALILWLHVHEVDVLRKRFIDFARVYGTDFESAQRNLYKYFAKSFGCRLADAGVAVPNDVASLLEKARFRTALRITFAVNEDTLILPEETQKKFIGKAPLKLVDRQDQDKMNGYVWNENVAWFTTHYWYNVSPDRSLGSTWVADSQYIYLGSKAPLSEDARRELIEKVSGNDAP